MISKKLSIINHYSLDYLNKERNILKSDYKLDSIQDYFIQTKEEEKYFYFYKSSDDSEEKHKIIDPEI